ncbi:MAG: tetratricopeptide repeat protein [archaeon]|nr:tetratricopeptide repeat protein [archaeon]
MNELIVRYYHSDNPSCQVYYRSNLGMQETEKFPFTFSVSKEERELIQWYLEEYLTYPYGAFQERARRAEKVISDLGAKLFEVVFRNKNDRDQAAIRFYDRAMENPTDCHIVIQADHPAGWSLPWEFMRDPGYGYLAQKTSGFVRSHPGVSAHLQPIRTDTPKINILMIISRPGGEEDVPFQSVARPLMEIFRSHRDRIQIDVLRPPTYEQLEKVLADKPNFYHILHFDGHGVFPRPGSIDYHTFLSEQGSQGQLVFENAFVGKRLVSGEELGELLSGKGVPVVMLNACQSGMTHPDALYPSIGGELIKTGALGVVAMAYSVYVHTAAQFMARVYEALINGQTLARAVTIARGALAVQDKRESPVGLISLQDWVVPVLFQSGNVQLFKPSEAKLHLDAGLIQGQQAVAGAEIDLPGQPDYGFIGRDADIWKLEKAFERETIVLLQAMAGVGKTTAAAGFARWWAETGALRGPIFFFSFESYITLAHVCDRIGGVFREEIKSQLGMEWHLLDPKQRLQLAVNILRQLPCLLIWDNFEPVAGFPKGTPSVWKQEEQEELKDFLKALSGGATKVIITSRRDEEWLGRCYQPMRLRGLNQRDAMELAGRVLNRSGIDRQKLKPYGKLLNYLQGNPLAIQVILPELAHIEPDELLVALQRGEAKLPKDDREQGRERSLTASLEYRLDRLDELLRSRLGVLGMFQGFVNAEVLALICNDDGAPELLRGLDKDAWIRMLDQASEIGLLHRVVHGLYNIHPALPWFFHQILRTTYAEDIEWLEKRFVDVCGYLSQLLQQQLHENAEVAMTWMRFEEQNFRYAIHLGRGYEMWDALNRILLGMAEMLGRQSRWSELELLNLEVKRAATDEQGAPLLGAEALCASLWHNLGMIAQERRDFDEAEEWYRKSLALKEKLKDEHGQARTLHQLGMIAEERRDFDEAEEWYRKSLEIEEKLKDEHGQARTLHQLGRIAEERRDFDEAERLYLRAKVVFEKYCDGYSLSVVRGSLERLHRTRA